MEKLLVMDPRLSDEAFGSLPSWRVRSSSKGPHEENDGKEQGDLGHFRVGYKQSIAQHNIPLLTSLLQRG